MKINVVSRRYFKKLTGNPELAAVIASHRIVSIQSSHGWDSRPPFPAGVLPHPNVLCIRFDDYCSFEEGCVDREVPWLFRRDDAERIVRFVVDDEKPLIVQCTEGISRSGAVGKAFDWYYNQHLHDNPEDHEFFVKNNPQISPNSLVFEIMMAYFEERNSNNENADDDIGGRFGDDDPACDQS